MADKENIVMSSDENKNNEQPSIMVPLDDMDSVSADSPHTVDELAQELATIRQSAKKIAIIGSRNLPITHQQMIETLAQRLLDRATLSLHPAVLQVQTPLQSEAP